MLDWSTQPLPASPCLHRIAPAVAKSWSNWKRGMAERANALGNYEGPEFRTWLWVGTSLRPPG